MKKWMIYGATGYTAALIIERCRQKGLAPILAGRDLEKTQAIAQPYGWEARVLSLNKVSEFEENLSDCGLLLNCAGPFIDTALPLVDACLKVSCHYLDITGEVDVFEALARRDNEARAAGIALLPGVGFDVVPSDCLLKAVAEQLPQAEALELALLAQGQLSRGTLKTMMRVLPQGNVIRRNGKLIRVPLGTPTATIPFPSGNRFGVSIPWGDVSTAYYSTGIENITVYSAMPRAVAFSLRALNCVRPLWRTAPVQHWLENWAGRRFYGPDKTVRENARVTLWARARKGKKTKEAWVEVPEGYRFTAETAVEAVERFCRETPKLTTGFMTPSRAFGSRFVTEFEDVHHGGF